MIDDPMGNSVACPFCSAAGATLGNPLAYALFDRYPVTPGHLLVLPRRHVADWFETTGEERVAIWALADEARALLLRTYQPDGFNLGVNVGEAAGQTIFHAHLHVIPRYRGDVANPRGGIRAVIPHRQQY
jgi:diadenosine tetraphosphate (Ap4A) HIT family hydrolase